MPEIIEYPYKAKPWKILFGILVCAAISVGMGHIAAMNDRGLIINRIFTLSVEGATIFYWCLAVVLGLLTLGGVLAVISGLNNSMTVRLSDDEISAPKNGFSQKSDIVSLSDIKEIKIQDIYKQRIILIIHRAGKLGIAESMLPDSKAFKKLYDGLVGKLENQR
jgi:hypothetical protein